MVLEGGNFFFSRWGGEEGGRTSERECRGEGGGREKERKRGVSLRGGWGPGGSREGGEAMCCGVGGAREEAGGGSCWAEGGGGGRRGTRKVGRGQKGEGGRAGLGGGERSRLRRRAGMANVVTKLKNRLCVFKGLQARGKHALGLAGRARARCDGRLRRTRFANPQSA